MKKYQTHLKPKTLFFLLLALAVTNSFAAEDEKPYQVIDGKIDENTFEGWKAYRGGTCGQCHGGAAQGLLVSLAEKIDDKARFIKVVTKGNPGTPMPPFKNNTRVMDNLDNIYAYIKARSDGVLGPENLIKFPLGKK